MREELEALRRLQTAMGDAEVSLARRMKLAPRDMTALSHIAFTAEPTTPSELGERLGVTRGAVTELVDRLERDGHVRRSRGHVDRRRVELHLTDSATSEVIAHLGSLFDGLDATFDDLAPDDRERIVVVLDRLAEVYHRYSRLSP